MVKLVQKELEKIPIFIVVYREKTVQVKITSIQIAYMATNLQLLRFIFLQGKIISSL